MARLMDLPDEILDMIVRAPCHDPNETRLKVLRSLALTNKRLRRIADAYQYSNVCVGDPVILNLRYQDFPWQAALVKTLSVEFGLSQYGSFVYILDKWSPSVRTFDLAKELQGILSSTSNLEGLRLHLQIGTEPGGPFPELPFILDFSGLSHLKVVHLKGFILSRDTIITLLSYRSVRFLALGGRFDRHTWRLGQNPIPRMTSSSIGEIHIITEDGVHLRALDSILPCLTCLSKLTVKLGPDMLCRRSLRIMWEHLGIHSRLTYLELFSGELPYKVDYELDFSAFSVLRRLVLHSVLLWPLRFGFERRNEFYKRLPQTLEVLQMWFPYSIDPRVVYGEIDGIFQVNTTIYPCSGELAELYAYQEIPRSRFDWLGNFLKQNVDPDHDKEVCLPVLRYVELSEEIYYPMSFPNHTRQYQYTVSLPETLAKDFGARNIELNIAARYYLLDELEEELETADHGMQSAAAE